MSGAITGEDDFRMTHQGDMMTNQQRNELLTEYDAQKRRIADLQAKVTWAVRELKKVRHWEQNVLISYLVSNLEEH